LLIHKLAFSRPAWTLRKPQGRDMGRSLVSSPHMLRAGICHWMDSVRVCNTSVSNGLLKCHVPHISLQCAVLDTKVQIPVIGLR
jgi:hypothetical protein